MPVISDASLALFAFFVGALNKVYYKDSASSDASELRTRTCALLFFTPFFSSNSGRSAGLGALRRLLRGHVALVQVDDEVELPNAALERLGLRVDAS